MHMYTVRPMQTSFWKVPAFFQELGYDIAAGKKNGEWVCEGFAVVHTLNSHASAYGARGEATSQVAVHADQIELINTYWRGLIQRTYLHIAPAPPGNKKNNIDYNIKQSRVMSCGL